MKAQTARKGEFDTLPPKPRKRQEGDPKEVMAFRPPRALADYLADIDRRGLSKTAALLELVDPMLEVRRSLGPEWWDLQKAAEAAGESIGATITRFVRAGLKRK